VVVGQADNDEAGDLALSKATAEVALELLKAELVGDAEVEGGVSAIRVFKDGFGNGRVEQQALAFGGGSIDFVAAFNFNAFAVVENAQAGVGDVFPGGAELGFVFGHRRVGATEQSAAAGLGRKGVAGAAVAIAAGPGSIEEGGGVDAHNPAMAVGRDVAIDVEVVADGVLVGEGVEIGRDAKVGSFQFRFVGRPGSDMRR